MARIDNNITPAHLGLNSFIRRAARSNALADKTTKVARKGLKTDYESKKVFNSRQYSIENGSN